MNCLRRHLCKAKVRLFCGCSYPIYPDSPDFLSLPRQVSNLEFKFRKLPYTVILYHWVRFTSLYSCWGFTPFYSTRFNQPQDFLYCNKQGHEQLRNLIIGVKMGFLSRQKIFLWLHACFIFGDSTSNRSRRLIPTPTFNGQLQLIASLRLLRFQRIIVVSILSAYNEAGFS